jgi:undecaprenyl-diphosphatase
MQLFEVEKLILKFFNQPINPVINSFMLFLNYSVYIYLLILLFYYYKKGVGLPSSKGESGKFLQLVFNSIVGVGFVFFLKYFIGRPRPSIGEFFPILNKPDPSFPSSHAFVSFLCLYFLPKESTLLIKMLSIIYLVAGIPISSMYLGVHYPSDILVGALLGILFPLIFREKISKYVIQKLHAIVGKLLTKIF